MHDQVHGKKMLRYTKTIKILVKCIKVVQRVVYIGLFYMVPFVVVLGTQK